MVSTADPLARFESDIARRYRTLIVLASIGDVAVIGIVSWIFLRGSLGAPFWLLIYAYIALPLSIPVLWWVLRFSRRRIVAMLREIQPMIRDISSRGILIILEGSIVMRLGGPIMAFSAFSAPDGTTLTPAIDTATRWATVRTQTVAMVTTRTGEPVLRARLQQIATQFGPRFGRLDVLVPRRNGVGHQIGWAIESRLTLPYSSRLRGETLRSELGRIRELLHDAKGKYFVERSSQPS